MFRLFDFQCPCSASVFEETVSVDSTGLVSEMPTCPVCNESVNVTKAINTHAGYTIKGDNGASVRPKGAGHRGGRS